MGKYQRTANAVSSMTAVNFSEMKISRNPAETLVAFSRPMLGKIWAPVSRNGQPPPFGDLLFTI